jgi:DNA topoisomerase VI subunit B
LAIRIVSPKDPSIDLIRILSEGTYTSFPQALKEFISNSYDAYATEVALQFDDDLSALSIRDNGEGMTSDDFTNIFASVARTGKSTPPTPDVQGLKRLKIGRFGIGALAVVGAADRFTIRSVKKASRNGFEASIDLKELRTHYEKGEDLQKVWRFALSEWGEECKCQSKPMVDRLNP